MKNLALKFSVAVFATFACASPSLAQEDKSPDFNDLRVIDAMEFCKTEADELLANIRTFPGQSFSKYNYWAVVGGHVHGLVNMVGPLSALDRTQMTNSRQSMIDSLPDRQKRADEIGIDPEMRYAIGIGKLDAKFQICIYGFMLQERYLPGAAKVLSGSGSHQAVRKTSRRRAH